MPILPTSLILRTNQCFYCIEESVNDEKTLGHDFGIRYCAAHEWDARRDSNAYLHEAREVRTEHALAHPILGPFLALLKQSVSIRRTSGMIEDDWRLQYEPWSEFTTLRFIKDDWHIPMIHSSSKIMKYVPLWTFQESELRALHNPAISEHIESVQNTLQEGIYKIDYDSYCLEQSAYVVPETAGVLPGFLNGRLARIFALG
jgi:hypothetical protein